MLMAQGFSAILPIFPPHPLAVLAYRAVTAYRAIVVPA